MIDELHLRLRACGWEGIRSAYGFVLLAVRRPTADPDHRLPPCSTYPSKRRPSSPTRWSTTDCSHARPSRLRPPCSPAAIDPTRASSSWARWRRMLRRARGRVCQRHRQRRPAPDVGSTHPPSLTAVHVVALPSIPPHDLHKPVPSPTAGSAKAAAGGSETADTHLPPPAGGRGTLFETSSSGPANARCTIA